jgi:hypothetical protein
MIKRLPDSADFIPLFEEFHSQAMIIIRRAAEAVISADLCKRVDDFSHDMILKRGLLKIKNPLCVLNQNV